MFVKLSQLTEGAGTITRRVQPAWKYPKTPMTDLEKITLCPHWYGWPWKLTSCLHAGVQLRIGNIPPSHIVVEYPATYGRDVL